MATEEEQGYFRVNAKISKASNKWLDEYSKEIGIPKSTLVLLAVEAFIDQKTVLRRMTDMGEIANQLEKVLQAIEKSERNDLN